MSNEVHGKRLVAVIGKMEKKVDYDSHNILPLRNIKKTRDGMSCIDIKMRGIQACWACLGLRQREDHAACNLLRAKHKVLAMQNEFCFIQSVPKLNYLTLYLYNSLKNGVLY